MVQSITRKDPGIFDRLIKIFSAARSLVPFPAYQLKAVRSIGSLKCTTKKCMLILKITTMSTLNIARKVAKSRAMRSSYQLHIVCTTKHYEQFTPFQEFCFKLKLPIFSTS